MLTQLFETKLSAKVINSWSPKKFALYLIISGALSALAFQPIGFVIAALVSFLLIYRFFEQRKFANKKQAFMCGFWAGFGYFAAGLYWVSCALHVDWVRFGWVLPLALFGIPCFLAPFFGLVTLACAPLKKIANRFVPLLAFVVIFSCLEWCRGTYYFTGFPWLNVSDIWMDHLVVLQSLSVLGSYGLGLITLFLGALIYAALFFDHKRRQALAVASILLILFGGGYLRLQHKEVPVYNKFELLIVQPSILQVEKWQRHYFKRNVEKLVSLTKKGLQGKEKPQLIIWPEASLPLLFEHDSNLGRYITHYLRPQDHLLLGAPRALREHDGTVYTLRNSLFVLGQGGDLKGLYDKTHLVPFGEYLPMRAFLPDGLSALAPGKVDYSPGGQAQTILLFAEDISFPSFSPLICYEAIFSGNVVDKQSGSPPRWLLNITNDGWYLNSSGPYQHLAMTRMRAIEEGLPLVRVVYQGVSAAFDPYGRTVLKIPFGQATATSMSLPKPLSQRTLFARYGHKIYFALLVLLTLLGGFFYRQAINRPDYCSS